MGGMSTLRHFRKRCSVSINTYARRIGVSLGTKNRLARSDPTKKTKPSAINAVPAPAAISSQSFAPATVVAPGAVGGTEGASMSLSSADAAKSISTSTERGVAWSGLSGSIVGGAATGAASTRVTASRAGTEAVSTTSGADAVDDRGAPAAAVLSS